MSKEPEKNQIIARGIKKAGSQKALAAVMKTSQTNVHNFLHNKVPVSPECVLPFVQFMAGECHPHELRPDIYPAPAEQRRGAA